MVLLLDHALSMCTLSEGTSWNNTIHVVCGICSQTLTRDARQRVCTTSSVQDCAGVTVPATTAYRCLDERRTTCWCSRMQRHSRIMYCLRYIHVHSEQLHKPFVAAYFARSIQYQVQARENEAIPKQGPTVLYDAVWTPTKYRGCAMRFT